MTSLAAGCVLRLLNASLARAYDLRLDNEQEMLLIARDLGFYPKGKAINSLILAPGERAEVLVNLSEGEGVSLISGAKRGIFDKIKICSVQVMILQITPF